jgi:cytolethal distending toxin subunit B
MKLFSRPKRLRTAARLGAVVALVAGALSVVATPAEAANLEQHRPATYNMQGAQGGDVTPKWATDIPELLQNHDVLALQEAGPLPPLDPNGIFHYQDSTTISGYTIYHYLRNFGTADRPILRHVYFLQTDPNGNRVNLAMVTEAEPDALWVTTPSFTGSRASFGVQLGNTIFNDVHGLSGSGNDIPGQLAAIHAGQGGAGWDYAVLGDFNRAPGSLNGRLPANANIYRPGVATQLSGGELDYMVASRYVPLFTGHAVPGISADHLPVEFGTIPLRAAAGYAIGSYSAYGGQERIVDIYQGSADNGTHAIVYDNHNSGNQHFSFVPTANGNYTIRNQSTNKCLDLNNGPRARAGDYINEWDCLGQRTQEWSVRYWTNDPGAAALVNVSTGYCLDVFRNGIGNGTWTDIWPCSGQNNQKWTLEYLGYSLATAAAVAQTPLRAP